MGVFIIHPNSAAFSDITCSLQEDGTTDFQVIPASIDLNEGARGLAVDGDVRGLDQFTVPIKFNMMIFGSTQADVMANTETLRQALMDEKGGYIEYRPRGLGTSVLTTWYEYRAGTPPVPTRGAVGFDRGIIDSAIGQLGREGDQVIMVRCGLDTKPWATSDPATLVTLVTATNIDNYDDDEHDNSVILSNSNMKGAGFLPVVYVGSSTENSVLMHVKKMRVGANSRGGWIEAEDYYGGSDWEYAGESGISGDACARTDGTLPRELPFAFEAFDSTYVGMMKFLLCLDNSYETIRWRLWMRIGDSWTQSLWLQSQPFDFEPPAIDTWCLIFGMPEMPFPAVPLPSWLTDTSTPSIGDWFTTYDNLTLVAERQEGPVGSHYLRADFIYAAAANDWIGIAGRSDINGGANTRLVFDAVKRGAYVIEIATNYWLELAEKRGSPWRDLVLRKGWDYRFTFMLLNISSFADGYGTFSHGATMNITVKGIHLTIYPFSET